MVRAPHAAQLRKPAGCGRFGPRESPRPGASGNPKRPRDLPQIARDRPNGRNEFDIAFQHRRASLSLTFRAPLPRPLSNDRLPLHADQRPRGSGGGSRGCQVSRPADFRLRSGRLLRRLHPAFARAADGGARARALAREPSRAPRERSAASELPSVGTAAFVRQAPRDSGAFTFGHPRDLSIVPAGAAPQCSRCGARPLRSY